MALWGVAAAADLASLDLFAGVDAAALEPVAASLTVEEHDAGDVLVREGEDGSSFLIVLDGHLTVSRGSRAIATVGPGSILGELVMLTGRPRMATATAETPVRVAVGDAAAFDRLVDLPVAHDRVAQVVAHRLAEAAGSVPVTLRDGSQLRLRPLLPEDRAELVDVIGRQTPEWLRYRFFSPGRPSSRTIDHLVNINYIDHFAWVAMGAESHRGVAIGRYIRLRDEPDVADISFGVTGEHQGRGLATILLGAVAATAATAGITELVAEVLHDNAPMRAVFKKAGGRWRLLEPGIGEVRMDVTACRDLIEPGLADAVVRTAREIVTGAGLALARPAPS
jgi:protein lysine acetyltransferase